MIRKAEKEDLPVLAELSCQLWPHHTVQEMAAEYCGGMANPDAAFFLAYEGDAAIGFAQCGLRHDYVEEPVVPLWAIWRASMCRRTTATRALPNNC